MEKQETIFRQKSIERVSSPEQLDQYLKVTSPSVWIILVGIIVILIGAIVWGAYGDLKTYATVGCVVDQGNAYCYIKEEDVSKIKTGMEVEIPDVNTSFTISSIGSIGVSIPDTYDYLQHLIGVSSSDYVFEMQGTCSAKQGYYKARVLIESISPLKFIYN